jgi:hypothetical protein
MRRRKLVLSAVGVMALILGGCALLVWYEATHLRLDINDEQLSNVGIALKGSIGQAVFGPERNGVSSANEPTNKQDLDAVLTVPVSGANEGVIEAYKRNPQEFKLYAQMFDTAVNAKRVGQAVDQLIGSRPPLDSSHLAMDSDIKVDAWGDPFCIIPITGRIAVVSGGPSKIGCDALPVSIDQIEKSDRNIFAGPNHLVVVIVPHEKPVGSPR